MRTGDSNIIMDSHIYILGLVTAALKGKNNMKSGNDSSEYTIYITFSILLKLTGDFFFKPIFKKQNITQIQQKTNACVVYMCVKPKSQSINM